MTTLKHPATGHEIATDDESVDFWTAAGYISDADKEPKKAAVKKAPAKKQSN